MATENTKSDKRIKNIIRYNVSRKYFGDWTPDELNNSYLSEKSLNYGTSANRQHTVEPFAA